MIYTFSKLENENRKQNRNIKRNEELLTKFTKPRVKESKVWNPWMKELKFAVGVFFNLCLKNGIKEKKETDESWFFSNGREEGKFWREEGKFWRSLGFLRVRSIIQNGEFWFESRNDRFGLHCLCYLLKIFIVNKQTTPHLDSIKISKK